MTAAGDFEPLPVRMRKRLLSASTQTLAKSSLRRHLAEAV